MLQNRRTSLVISDSRILKGIAKNGNAAQREYPLARNLRGKRKTAISLLAVALAGCDGAPTMVFIPEDRPSVRIEVAVSSKEIPVGEELVLYATQYSKGNWRQVRRSSLHKAACWVARPPQKIKREVADTIHWTVTPEGNARFNTEFRADHTRAVIFSAAGRYSIRGRASVWCGPPQDVVPAELEVNVTDRKGS